MPAFFSSHRGQVARIAEGRGQLAFQISVGGKDFQKAIVTQAVIDNNGNFQFLHTVQDTIYVYVFGDRVGDLVISGLAFLEPCGNCGPGATPSGVKEVLDFYDQQRIAASGEPVSVAFGDVPFSGFLTGVNVSVADAENMLSQYTYRFKTFPVL